MAGKSIAVLGAGPVGTILAANFAKAGKEVLLIESYDKRCEMLKQHGLSIIGKQEVSARAKMVRSVDELKDVPIDALFICTKTWTLKSILPALAEVLDPEALVVSSQNGIGPEDDVAQYFSKERVARAIINYAGGLIKDTGAVTMQWFNPPNYLGPLDEKTAPRLEQLSGVLNQAGLTTQTIPECETRKLSFFKTILNSALNALCAASGITMRQAMTYRHTRNLARMLLREGLTVGAAVGYSYGESSMETCMRYLDAGGDHLPSMWTDLQRGCPTEIEYINGKIVKIGSMFKHCNVDVNRFFTAAIITQEIKSGVREPGDIPEYLVNF
jgi:2-dehydropantoate 2-reductase